MRTANGNQERPGPWKLVLAASILLAGSAAWAQGRLRPPGLDRKAVIEGIVADIDAPGVSTKARSIAAELVREMFARMDSDVLNELGRRHLRIDIIHPGNLKVNMVPIPVPGGKPKGVPPLGRAKGRHGGAVSIEISEASLLPTEDLPPLTEGYPRPVPLSNAVHELAHAADFACTREEQGYHGKLFDLQHARKAPFPSKYASNYPKEYFAGATEVFFGAADIVKATEAPQNTAAGGAGPQWLSKNAPEMFEELKRIFGPPKDLSALGARPRGKAVFQRRF